MTSSSGAVRVLLSSPSFNDSEAASQQLLAEASSPVRRPPAAPSSSAVVGANLLNHARTLTKPQNMTPVGVREQTRKLPKLGNLKPMQLKPGQLKAIQLPKPGRLEKPGKLARASLSSLVSEAPSKKTRGDKMYDIDPSPQKKRPHSLPSQIAALEDDGFADEVVMREGDDIVPETSQAQPMNDALGGSEDVPIFEGEATIIAFQPKNAVERPEIPIAPPRRQRGRPPKSGESADSALLPDLGTGGTQVTAETEDHLQDHSEVDHLPSSPPEMPEAYAGTKKRRGRPRKSGGSTASAGLYDAEQPPRQGEPHPPVLSSKLKRKTRTGEEQEIQAISDPKKPRPTKRERRLDGPAMISPDALVFEEDVEVSRPTTQLDTQPPGAEQPEARIPIRSTRLRTARAEAEVASAQEHSATAIISAAVGPKGVSRTARTTRSAMSNSEPGFPKRKSPASKRRSERETARGKGHAEEIIEESTGKDVGVRPTIQENQLDNNNTDVERHVDVTGNGHDIESGGAAQDEEENQQDNEPAAANDQGAQKQGAQDNNSVDEDSRSGDAMRSTENVSRVPELDKVFNFKAFEERSGVCSTKLGSTIQRRCNRSRMVLSRSDEDCSLDDIIKCRDNLLEPLRSIGAKVHDERRTLFKRDAFTYLFRNLTLVLEAMHDKLQEKQGNITESLESLQIVYPFIHELLRFKDTMDSWKVVVHQLKKGDRLIRGVEGDLIVPLRVIERDFGRRLRRLEQAEMHRQAAAEQQRQREVREREAFETAERLRPARERRKRWQDLHIVRMQCEPDLSRRRRLRFIEPVQAADTDANGRPFERVPFFGERSAPPPQWTVASSDREWTDEQETALLDVLQSSTSLERIFETHCGPDGVLRDFSVSDIAAKLIWIRSGWTQLSQQHGWKVPDWVKKIPVLP